MKIRILAACLILGIVGIGCASTPKINATKLPDDVRGQQIKDFEFGMFICWSFSSVSGKEWTRESHGPEFFKVTGCDTDQWCETAKAGGMKYIQFLAKHHDGFCLWDTKTTDLKVTNSPLGVDVLAKLRKSCDKTGLKLALYFSGGDWRHPLKTPEQKKQAAETKKAQYKELLTLYGPIEFVYEDNAACGDGGLSHEETVKWVTSFQPNCFMGFNHGQPAGRLIIRERGTPGKLGDPRASRFNKQAEANHKGYHVAEFEYPISNKWWFYQPYMKDKDYHSAEKIYQDYLGAVEYENIFSLAVGPDRSGKLRKTDLGILKKK